MPSESEKIRVLENYRKIRERYSHYMRLGFTYDELLSNKLILDDRLWEKVKNLPIDPSNEYDRLLKELNELKGLGREEMEKGFRNIFKKIFNKKVTKTIN